ncbi:hypothetical protein BGLA2_630032 [Burkholderia gladioli]|nr:hypothetical protein BGLA2_630032 [Burkholderia gladioli]
MGLASRRGRPRCRPLFPAVSESAPLSSFAALFRRIHRFAGAAADVNMARHRVDTIDAGAGITTAHGTPR